MSPADEGGHGVSGEGATEGTTYSEILRSSAWMGASSALTLVIGLVRTKAIAVLLGPSGIGLLGLYGSIVELARSLAGMGINGSGVRQIAAAVGSGEARRVAATATVLRRMSLLLGLWGALLVALFCVQWSRLTFGTDRYAGAVMVLALAVFLQLLADGRIALVQGMRRVGDLAKTGVLAALSGTVASIVAVLLLGERGVALIPVAVAGTSLALAWWYARKQGIVLLRMSFGEVRRESRDLLRLGLAFLGSGLLMMGAAYAVRTIVMRQLGVDAAGFYQAAWTLAGLYVVFVLNAMGADFYPRLVGVANDRCACNRYVNEQTYVGLLLAGPGVMATLAFAPPIVTLLYTSEFQEAVGLLRWICLGMALRVATWPMGYIVIAQGRQLLFLASEVVWAVANVLLTWQCIGWFGLEGVGIAFFASYLVHAAMMFPIARRLTGFRWSGANGSTASGLALGAALVCTGFYVLPAAWATLLGATAALLAGLHSLRMLLRVVGSGPAFAASQRLALLLRIPRAVRK